MDDLNAALKTLLGSLVDSTDGYDEALQKANSPLMTELFRNMIAMRTGHIGEIDQLMTGQGLDVDNSGTLMSVVHRTVIDIRSMVTGLDAGALPAFVSGEEAILKQYDIVAALATEAPTALGLMKRQRESVSAQVDGMRRLAVAA